MGNGPAVAEGLARRARVSQIPENGSSARFGLTRRMSGLAPGIVASSISPPSSPGWSTRRTRRSPGLVGIAPRAAAEIIVEVGDIRRFTEAGFARPNGTAPIPASSGEGENAPIRHRLSRGGNRRLNAAIYRIAMIQLHYEPRARQIHDQARANGHT